MAASSKEDRSAIGRAWFFLGATLAAPTFLAASLWTVDGDDVAERAVVAILGAVAVQAGVVAGLIGERWLPHVDGTDVGARFAGPILVAGALVLGIAAYVSSAAVALGMAASVSVAAAIVLWVMGALLVGGGCAPVVRLTPRRWGVVAIVSLCAGLALSWLLPSLAVTVSRFAATREWALSYPDSLGSARGYIVLGAVWAIAAAAALPRLTQLSSTTSEEHSDTIPIRPAPALLEVRDVDVSYGRVQVLFDVDLHVEDGEAVALLGTNGAGKSTLLRTVFGLKSPDRGHIRFGDHDITGRPAESLVPLGMAQVPGGRGIFPSLTVLENLRMAGYRVSDRAQIRSGIERALDAFPALNERLQQPAGVLSGGEQQMLALARAWIQRPRLLAIDELTLGLAPQIVEQMLDFVAGLRSEGISLLLVEQSVNTALRVAERAYFLERGAVRFEGRATDLLERPDLVRSVFLEGAGATGAA